MGLDRTDAQIAVNGAFAQAEAFVSNNVEEFDPSQVDDVAKVVDALGRAFAKNRLAAHEDITSDYPERKRAGGGGGGGGGGNWKKGGSSSSGSGDSGITSKQTNLIKQLIEEKVGGEQAVEAAGGLGKLDKGSASKLIGEMFDLDSKEE